MNLSFIQLFLDVHCKKTGNSSYSVPKKKIVEFLSLIQNVIITEASYFGMLSYLMAYRHPYCHGKSGFKVKNSKVYIVDSSGKNIYSGCSLNDNHFKGLRVNLCDNYFGLYFDYVINGSYSRKCLSYKIADSAFKNDKAAEEIQRYRELYFSEPQKSIKHLILARQLSSDIVNLLAPLFDERAVSGSKFPLKRPPLTDDVSEAIVTAMLDIKIPGFAVFKIFYIPQSNTIALQCAAVEEDIKESANRIVSASLKKVIYCNVVTFEAFTEDLCDYVETNNIDDLYDIASKCWVSDLLLLCRETPDEDIADQDDILCCHKDITEACPETASFVPAEESKSLKLSLF